MKLTYPVPDVKQVRVIIDTDTACEADDPFAIAHALMSPKLRVQAVIAEHFAQEGSMHRSYEAIQRLAAAMALAPRVLLGEEWPLDETRAPSEGVSFIIEEARREDSHPLYVLCLGALSNIARALALAPDIAGRLTIVSIGGRNYDNTPDGFHEFNFGNDVDAANAVLTSEAPLWQIPVCSYGSIRTGLAELQRKVAPCGAPGKHLYEQMVAYNQTPGAGWTPGESWSLGDSPAVAVVLMPSCGQQRQVRVRHVNADTSYSDLPDGRFITVYESVDSRYILEDFFAKLALCYGE